MLSLVMSLLGVILLVAPFGLVLISRVPVRAFAGVGVAVVAAHTFLAIGLQALGVFSTMSVLLVHLVGAVGVGGYLYRHRGAIRFPGVDWVFVGVLAVLCITLIPVHFSYDGTISTVRGYQEVQSFSYTYPYFSDEWVAASYADTAIGTGRLPLTNSLNPEAEVVNFWLPFHSLVAELSVLLNVDPIRGWAYLSTAFGVLFGAAMYLFVKTLSRSKLAAVMAALWVPYIVNGANLPASWYFIPFTFSLVVMLLVFTLWVFGERRAAMLSTGLLGILYPPLLFVLVPAICVWLFQCRGEFGLRVWVMWIAVAGAVVSGLVLASPYVSFSEIVGAVAGAVVRTGGLTSGMIPEFYFWRVLPIIVLVFVSFGVRYIWRQAPWLLAAGVTGSVLWLVYSQQVIRLVIGYPRVAVFTSLVVVAVASIGVSRVWAFMVKTYPWLDRVPRSVPAMVMVVLFAGAGLFYTGHDDWRSLVLTPPGASYEQKILPSAPANRYLLDSELDLFSSIEPARFIAPPWKGLVIGAATDNVPLVTKSSAVTVRQIDFRRFYTASCEERAALARKHDVVYVYVPPRECPQFEEVGRIKEDRLVLYKL